MLKIKVNGKSQQVDVEPEMPLLWVLRDQLGMTGTKFGCGIAQCGACTVHINGEPVRSCSYPVSAAVGSKVMTIEGLSKDGTHPVQMAWKALDMARLRVEALSQGVLREAEAALRVAEAAYRFGERGILDVLDAQRVLRTVRADLLQARYQQQSARIALDQLSGQFVIDSQN